MASTISSIETNAKEIVMRFIEALNAEDFKTARMYASDDMKFIGVLGIRDGADAYFKDMEKMKLKYKVQKTFAESDDVCIFSDLTISGTTILCCSWYHVSEGRIDMLKVIFDPRPLLEKTNKN